MPIPNNGTLQDVITLLQGTQGINAKAELASVIGSPAQNADAILYQTLLLQQTKLNMITNVNDKGVALPNTATMEDVALAIGNIDVGRKYASGTVSANNNTVTFRYYGTTGTTAQYFVTVSGLTFKPSIIKLAYFNNDNTYSITEYNSKLVGSKLESCRMYGASGTSLSTTSMHIKANDLGANVTDTGFTIPAFAGGVTYEWEAWS